MARTYVHLSAPQNPVPAAVCVAGQALLGALSRQGEGGAGGTSQELFLPISSVKLGAADTCAARPPLLPAARWRGGIRPGRGDVAEAVTAAVARSGTPAPAKGAFTVEKRPLLPAGWLSVAGVILRLGHSISASDKGNPKSQVPSPRALLRALLRPVPILQQTVLRK